MISHDEFIVLLDRIGNFLLFWNNDRGQGRISRVGVGVIA